MKKRAMVTGATGLLGGNLCRTLLDNGWEVKALARSEDKARRLLGDTGAEIIRGDMMDIPAFADELDGVTTLFHTAAFFREYYQPGNHWDLMKKINVDAAMELFREAEARGVERCVHTSSSGVIQTDSSGPADESAPYNSYAEKNLYFKTKVLLEREIFRMLESSPMDIVLVLPGWMMGPGDAAPTSAGKLVLDLLARKIPALIDGGASLADARDVAAAMLVAAEKGKRGERYIVTGELVTMTDIATTLESITSVPAPRGRMPNWLAFVVAWFSETWASISGGENTMPIAGVSTLMEKANLSSEKAKRELGAQYRPLRDTLEDTVNWYRRHDYL